MNKCFLFYSHYITPSESFALDTQRGCDGTRGGKGRGHDSSNAYIYHYYKEPRDIKRNCLKLIRKNAPPSWFANATTTAPAQEPKDDSKHSHV